MIRLIEKVWYSQSRYIWLLWPFSFFFYLIVQTKRFLYKRNILSSQKFSVPVIVIGNITVGGTGKTPFIHQLIKHLNTKGYKVGIVSRGYKAECQVFPHQLSDEDDANLVGDEALMQYRSLNHLCKIATPIVIDPNRSRAVTHLINNNDIDLVISDDGLQHYAMSRDSEIVLFDFKRSFGNKFILPFGPLREPVSRLKSVDLVVQNGSKETSYTDCHAQLVASEFIHLKTGESFPLDFFRKKNKSVNATAAIGHPQRFFETLSELVNIDDTRSFIDHHSFIEKDFISYSDKLVVMTEKDAVKCMPFAKDNWYYLKVEMKYNKDLVSKLDSLISNLFPKSFKNEVKNG